jgi:hypothetical protein
MNRTAATLLASLLVVAAAACGPTPTPMPLTNVTIWWEFDRNTLIDRVPGIVPYDTLVNWPPGTGSRACPQSGVDFVIVFDNAGNQLSPPTPCINQNVQGAVITGFQAPSVYWIEGWRNGVSVPLYRGQVTIDGLAPPPAPAYSGTAIAAGIQSDLTIDLALVDAGSGPAGYRTCGQAGVDQFQGWVEDGFGTLVWRNIIDCGPSFMPSIQYGLVDRDDLFIWIDTYDNRFNPAAIPWSICDFGFGQFRNNLFSLPIPLGVCTPAPPALRASE